MQFIGKKMRSLTEEEVAAIKRTIEGWKGASKADTAALHALERRRDKLLADDKALTALLEEAPHLDVQHLRTLIRNARVFDSEKAVLGGPSDVVVRDGRIVSVSPAGQAEVDAQQVVDAGNCAAWDRPIEARECPRWEDVAGAA